MAKATNNYRIEHDGQVWTRGSNRTYTHAVVAPNSLAEEIASAEAGARYSWKANQGYHHAWVNGTSQFQGLRTWDTTDEQKADKLARDAAQVEQSKAWIEGGLEGLLADARARATARWRETYGDRDTGWFLVGFNGNRNLAAKAATKYPGSQILEATQA
jgi:hypothetical protein